MKILKRSFIALVILILLYLAFALSLPNHYGVTRSVTVQAPAAKVYAYLAAPKEWKKWSVWNQRDPNMEMLYSGPEQGSGASWDWKSKSEGNGGMKFISVSDNQVINYTLHFEGMGKPSTGVIMLETEGTQTKISWSMNGTTEGNFMMKLFVPFMDKMIGPDFEQGLKNLKALAEK